MISIVIVLFVQGLCFYLGVLYTNQVLLRVGYAIGILLFFAIVELIYRFFTLEAYLDAPISMTEQGRPVVINLKLRNKGIFPAGKIEMQMESKNVFQKKKRLERMVIWDVPLRESKHRMKMHLQGAGCHDVFLKQIIIYSFFGLIGIKKKCNSFCSILILPEIFPMKIDISENVRNFIGDADVYDDFRPGYDTSETFEIREYQEKDKLQKVHWKLSAKMDKLMVKESSLPKACAIVLMLELQPTKIKKEYLNILTSLSYSLMDRNCPHFIAWYSVAKENICRIRVDDEESFYLFLNTYLREVVPAKRRIREEYRQKYKNEWYLHDITINEKLELYQNDVLVRKFDEKNIKDACEKLELLL